MPASYLAPTLIVGALIVLAFVGMAFGWRARRHRTALPPLPPVPADAGELLLEVEALYLATTLREQPLERVVSPGLPVRARATVAVHADGAVLALRGSDPLFLPADRLDGAGLATYAIDRGVERDGLVVLAWTIGDRDLDTYLRPTGTADAAALVAAVQSIARGSVASTPDGNGTEN